MTEKKQSTKKEIKKSESESNNLKDTEKNNLKQNAEEKPEQEKIEVKTEEKKQKKKKEKVALIKVKKPEKVKKLRDLIKLKRKKKPTFRGRFGKKSIRKKSIEKWQKWRKPRGIDIKRKKEDGKWPKPGFGSERQIKHLHPSGFKEVIVSNPKQLDLIEKDFAVRIASTVGSKKRKQIVKKANELGLHVLNY